MIKTAGVKDGKPFYIFGLSQGNMQNLLAGKPILIDLDVMTMKMDMKAEADFKGTVLLMGGTDENHIIKQLETSGVELKQ